jgi:hypothetical protein
MASGEYHYEAWNIIYAYRFGMISIGMAINMMRDLKRRHHGE